MPIESMLAVLLLAVLVNVALFLGLARSRRVVVRWPAVLGRLVSGRSQRAVADVPTIRRRPVYVASGTAGERPFDPFAALPPDLAALLESPAPFAPAPEDEASIGRADPGGDCPAPEGSENDEETEAVSAVPARFDAALATIPPAMRDVGPGLAPDPATGLEGPAGWVHLLEVENARLLRHRRPVTVVVIELEGLARLVDWQGEEAGLRLVIVLAGALRRQVRASDWLARIGSARFGALLQEADEIQAIDFVERIRVTCEPWLASTTVPLRLAIGWASPPASADIRFAADRAEERMHVDRRNGGEAAPAPRGWLGAPMPRSERHRESAG